MARPSVIPGIKDRLEGYLNKKEAEFLDKGPAATPTLPITHDWKVNVSAIAREIGLTPNQEKYLYEHHDLRSLVNLIACERRYKTEHTCRK